MLFRSLLIPITMAINTCRDGYLYLTGWVFKLIVRSIYTRLILYYHAILIQSK